jgi:iron(III) transport system permease protein
MASTARAEPLQATWGRRLASWAVAPALIAWATAAVILVLVGLVVWMSFSPGVPGEPGFTLNNYLALLGQPRLVTAVLNTLQLGIGTLLVASLFGIPIAWLIARTDIPGRSLLVSLIAIEVLVPGFLKAMGWIMLLSPNIGLLNQLVQGALGLPAPPFNIFGIGGIAFVQGLSLMPTMFFLISGAMRSLDPALEEAAAAAGARPVTTVARVTLPLVGPAILAGMIYIFMIAIAIYDVPALLGGRGVTVLSTELFSLVTPSSGVLPRYGVAAVYGLCLVVPSAIALAFYFRTIKTAHRYAVVTGKGYRPRVTALGWWRWPALAFALLYVLLASVFPTLVLFWTSLLPGLQMPSAESLARASMAHYGDVFRVVGGTKVLINTAILVLVPSLLVLFLSFMISWVVVRTQSRGRYLLDTIAMVPHAIPGLVFAFAAAVAGILLNKWFGIPLYGTLLLIVCIFVIDRVSFTTRVTNAALLQVHAELEEAAYLSGASRFQAMARVVIPLIGPSLMFGLIWNALWAVKEVTMPLLLTTPQNEVLAVRIWSLWASGNSKDAATLGIYLIVVAALFVIVLQRLRGFALDSSHRG